MSYQVELSARAARDLDRLDSGLQRRVIRKLEQLSEDPYHPRLSGGLTNQGELRKARVSGWRIIFTVDAARARITVVTIERRGQVYKRIQVTDPW